MFKNSNPIIYDVLRCFEGLLCIITSFQGNGAYKVGGSIFGLNIRSGQAALPPSAIGSAQPGLDLLVCHAGVC